jgi:poly-beta-hydroxyalkanoate depolymerase
MKWTELDADMAGSYAAVLRAARRAREIARMHGVPIVIWRDGKVVEVYPDDPTFDLPDDGLRKERPQ